MRLWQRMLTLAGMTASLGAILTGTMAFGASYDLLASSSFSRAQEMTKLTAFGQPQPLMAAGFGYQAAGTSTILVRTYDPSTGAVLTEDSYDLDVHEEGTPTSTSTRERIFAGGVGLGADGLSQFLLRVYDAATGKFLWEGQLNLNPAGRDGNASPVATMVRPRATVTLASIVESSSVHPFFFIRARDPLSGALIWQDHFAAEGQGIARIERMAYERGRAMASTTGLHHTFDFMILAYDAGKRLLWQDAFDSLEEVGKSVQEEDDRASLLPLWHQQEERTIHRELIRYRPLR